MRRVETLSNSAPGLAFIGLRPVYLLNLETAEVPMSEAAQFPCMCIHQSEDWAGGSRWSFKVTRLLECQWRTVGFETDAGTKTVLSRLF